MQDTLHIEILTLFKSGKSNASISRMLGCSTVTVWRILKQNNISRIKKIKNPNWEEIQDLYDSGISEKDLRQLGHVTRRQLDNAKKSGIFIPRSKKEINILIGKKTCKNKHTEEFKLAQSKRMSERHKQGVAYTLGHNERNKKTIIS